MRRPDLRRFGDLVEAYSWAALACIIFAEQLSGAIQTGNLGSARWAALAFPLVLITLDRLVDTVRGQRFCRVVCPDGFRWEVDGLTLVRPGAMRCVSRAGLAECVPDGFQGLRHVGGDWWIRC